jgi:hypothetical protein
LLATDEEDPVRELLRSLIQRGKMEEVSRQIGKPISSSSWLMASRSGYRRGYA